MIFSAVQANQANHGHMDDGALSCAPFGSLPIRRATGRARHQAGWLGAKASVALEIWDTSETSNWSSDAICQAPPSDLLVKDTKCPRLVPRLRNIKYKSQP